MDTYSSCSQSPKSPEKYNSPVYNVLVVTVRQRDQVSQTVGDQQATWTALVWLERGMRESTVSRES